LTVIIIKQYEKSPNNWLLLATVLSEMVLIYSYIKLLKNDNIITLFGLVKFISILLVIAPGIIFFGSKLTIKQIIGIIFAIISIYLLN
jgi:multidrug transporter EmrE-like cation transporter